VSLNEQTRIGDVVPASQDMICKVTSKPSLGDAQDCRQFVGVFDRKIEG
jgi:hypothetical protein